MKVGIRNKNPRVQHTYTPYTHCLAMVGSRNEFEIKSIEDLM